MVRFFCKACGSLKVSVSLPDELSDDAHVKCSHCARPLLTWGAFKQKIACVVAGSSGLIAGEGCSSDPLPAGLLPAPAEILDADVMIHGNLEVPMRGRIQ
jgi:hypothetical protein